MRRIGGLTIALAIMFVGCSSGNPLVGTWKLASSDLNATFVFRPAAQNGGKTDDAETAEMKAFGITLAASGLKFTSAATKATEEYRKKKEEYLSSIEECPTKVALIGVDRSGTSLNTEGAYQIVGRKLLIWFGETADYRTWLAEFSIDGKTMTWKTEDSTLTLTKE